MNCHNCQKYLKTAIDSVYKQTYRNWEIIFFDNCSSDQSANIAKSYDQKLKYKLNSQKTILGEARFNAAKYANGDLIAFLDCDDKWLPKKLEKQIKYFKNDNIGLVYAKTKVIYEDNPTLNFIFNKNRTELCGDIFEDLLKENFITFSSAIVDRIKFEKVGGFPKHYKNSTDYFLFLNLSKEYHCIGVNEVLCEYRVHSSNLSETQRIIAIKEVIESLENLLPDEKIKKGLKYHYAHLALALLKERKFFDSTKLIFKYNLVFSIIQRIYKTMLIKINF